MRYRLREDAGMWVLEANQGGTWWERHGAVTDSESTLRSGRVYVITHREGEPCELVVNDVPMSDLGL